MYNSRVQSELALGLVTITMTKKRAEGMAYRVAALGCDSSPEHARSVISVIFGGQLRRHCTRAMPVPVVPVPVLKEGMSREWLCRRSRRH